ncbi:ABC transporter permease subunit [Chroococcidiopsis sp. CCMEE 29]|uniref:ABC transporter permease subunit n=1 Tax=Chroococcidiopsis sp. CCMEE 29 TaxID=155894 RepID=UPI00202146A6|nr:ABC transporter permease subunit [Chroococcidiopsis sp. CCMEE 29]
MITDICTVLWKEWRELLFQRGSLRSIMLSLLPSVVLFGVLLPSQVGHFWVESPLLLGLWGWLPTLPVTAVIADAFAGERERHTLETLLASPLSEQAILFGKVGAVVGYGWGLTLLILLVGLVTVNVVDSNGELLLYPLHITLGGVVLGLLTATLAASAGVLVSLRSATVRQAAQQLAFASIALTWIPIFGFSLLPSQVQTSLSESVMNANATQLFLIVVLVLAVLDAGLLLVAMARFGRSRLILD